MEIAAAIEQLRRAFKERGISPIAIVVSPDALAALQLSRDARGDRAFPDVGSRKKSSIAGIEIRVAAKR